MAGTTQAGHAATRAAAPTLASDNVGSSRLAPNPTADTTMPTRAGIAMTRLIQDFLVMRRSIVTPATHPHP
jgi:hypothetical protein